MRILCHAQHLSGVGHFVRMQALARGLAANHEVHLVDGGRAVPSAPQATEPHKIFLPPIVRTRSGLIALNDIAPGAVLAERARLLADAVERIRPNVLLVDHYPFSKWELDQEIVAAIDTARRCQPDVRIVCSLRDVVRQTRHEQTDRATYEQRVIGMLRARFDAILVHCDPSFTRLEEHFAPGADLPLPVAYTGFVVPHPERKAPPPGSDIVLSCGGGRGIGSLIFLLAAVKAFQRLPAGVAREAARLVVFPGAFASDAEISMLEAAAAGGAVRIERFDPEFHRRLGTSTLSISRAGYNTCAALLDARVRAVLAPDPSMSDQEFRARRLAELGLATLVDPEQPPIDALIAAITTALAAAAPEHRFDLNGVEHTRTLVESRFPS